MEEKDFQRIEQVISKAVKAEVGKAVKAELESVKEDIKTVQAQVDSVSEGVKTELRSFKSDNDAKLDQFRKEIRKELNEDFRHHVGILSEDFQHKLQLVAEGHQMLSEKMDRMRGEMGHSMQSIDKKIDAVAADVAAHRADTEGHKRGYMVQEP